jgi:DNA-binding transcriptional ArsR family regulator
VSPPVDRGYGLFTGGTTLDGIAAIAAWGLAREVLVAVVARPRSVSQLADDIELDVTSVSRCLRSLLHAGVLSCKQEGRWHVYYPGPSVAATTNGSSLTLALSADTGARVILEMSASELEELRRFDHSPGGPEPESGEAPKVVVRPAGARGPRGRAGLPPRRPSGPG